MENKAKRPSVPSTNPDAITGAPGSHPAGTGIGAAAGGAAGIGAAVGAGALMGTVVGPVGTVVGAAVGAVVGGLAGKAAAEGVNPTAEHEYWRNNYATRSYVQPGASYDEYGPAYQYGWEARQRFADKRFNDVESNLTTDWDRAKGSSSLQWAQASPAVREGWEHVSHDNDPRQPE